MIHTDGRATFANYGAERIAFGAVDGRATGAPEWTETMSGDRAHELRRAILCLLCTEPLDAWTRRELTRMEMRLATIERSARKRNRERGYRTARNG